MNKINRTEQWQFIAGIREKKGILENGSQKEGFEHVHTVIKNSGEIISTELYGKETHFVLELIQNAEDNKYKEKVPELCFVVLDKDPTNTPDSDGCLCVFNNESGFEKENVASICDIGRSTKEKAMGYVGEKGIGFKSVFTVCSAPHIYSNGYQFQFKDKDPDIDISYIVPYWLDSTPAIVAEKKANTAILLPLKSGKKNDIVHRLKQIQPETILFLSKLKGLSVHIADALLKIDRMQNSACAPVVDLLTQGDEQTKNRYWLHVDTVTVPNDIKEEKRENITSREVTIAFPLENNSRAGIIYAFLPTEVDSGLPFLINADFILTANRESIQSDKRWNIWLRDELADIVVQGLVELSKRQEYRKSLCGFIPLADEIKSLKDYFEPVCMEVCSRLSDMSIILSDKDELIMPSDARLASKNIRKIFCGDSRAVAFDDFKFVHAELEKYGKQLKAVGVKQFSDDDIRECLSDEQWLSTRDSHWYVDLYDFLSHKKLNDLENLLIILKQGGGLASPSQKTYFPADHSLVMTLNERLSTTGLPKPIFIDEQLHELLSNKQELSDWVKRELKVTDFNISRYVGNTLVPWLYESVAEITGESLLEAVQFILEYWQDITKEDKEIIGKTIPLLLDDGLVTRPDALQGFELLTPRNHDKDKGWQLVLTTEKDCEHEDVLSDDYINLNEKYIGEFLEAVNAQRYPALENHCISIYEPLQNYSEYIEERLKSMVGRDWPRRGVITESGV